MYKKRISKIIAMFLVALIATTQGAGVALASNSSVAIENNNSYEKNTLDISKLIQSEGFEVSQFPEIQKLPIVIKDSSENIEQSKITDKINDEEIKASEELNNVKKADNEENKFFGDFLTGRLHWSENELPVTSKENIEFTVDYRLFFKDNTQYNKDLAMLASLYAADIYKQTYVTINGVDHLGIDHSKELGTYLGLEDIEDIEINGEDYETDHDDSSEFLIGHRKVTYEGVTKEIISVTVRGTNGTNQEWSSNFDVGADTKDYYEATGYNHPYWLNKQNHKGFDVAANRILEKIDDYLTRHNLHQGKKSIFITGHSRGAAIANLLGAYFEDDKEFDSYTYTFAAPNPTTDPNAASYRTIFNLVNSDDNIAYLPLRKWGFTKYGVMKTVSIAGQFENHIGYPRKHHWEWLTGRDYDNDASTLRTLNAFAKIANSREDLYVIDDSNDAKVWENDFGHMSLKGAKEELAQLTMDLEKEKLLKFCRLSIVDKKARPYYVEVNYCPAYVMQMLANMTTGVGPLLGRDTAGRYYKAKASFVLSSGKLTIKGIGPGGMTDPHLPITYYFIAWQDKF